MVHMREAVIQVLNQIDDVMYYPILIIVHVLGVGVETAMLTNTLTVMHSYLKRMLGFGLNMLKMTWMCLISLENGHHWISASN